MLRFLKDLRRAGREGIVSTWVPSIILAGLALLVFAALTSLYMSVRGDRAGRLVEHTLRVQAAIADVVLSLQSAESSQRGYLISGSAEMLADFERRADRIAPSLKDIERRVSDNPEQLVNLTTLRPLIDDRMELLRSGIELKRAGREDQAKARERLERGRHLMQQVKGLVTRLDETESRLLADRQQSAAEIQQWLLIVQFIGIVLALALSWLGFGQIREYVTRLTSANDALANEMKLRRDTEATLRQAQKMEAVGQLTGGIAHDFNNLLTLVIGGLDTLQRRLKSAARQPELDEFAASLAKPVEMAQQGARSAAQLTHRLLAFSRQQALQPASVDINKLVGGLSEMLRRTVGETIEVETVLAGGLWPTFADPHQIENALINLAVNARDAMPEGGKLTVETGNAYLDDAYVEHFGDVAAGQYVQLSVSDTGTGIPPAVLERVFEPFFTTKETGKGTGLGLAMVHGFVKQSRGHVRIYSEAGQGTTVKVYLPRHTEMKQASVTPAGAPREVTAPPSRARKAEKVLLVEDNDGVREYAQSVLADLGYQIRSASSGPEALEIIGQERDFAALFTDVVLPGGMSGRDLATAVLQRFPGLPVLYTTGYTRNAIVHNGTLDADVSLLHKPYTPRDLADKLRQVIDDNGA